MIQRSFVQSSMYLMPAAPVSCRPSKQRPMLEMDAKLQGLIPQLLFKGLQSQHALLAMSGVCGICWQELSSGFAWHLP
jgi:hypothetical protein